MPLSPSGDVLPFSGYVDTTADALRLIQAARCGIVPRITRRLNELERRAMIKSGAVFVFSVEESGIKRWTDGYTWTPSRISGNFLVYREVVERLNRGASLQMPASHGLVQRTENHVALKLQGLIKKTITVKIGGSDHHLICYYTHEDIRSGRLQRPTAVPAIMSLDIPHELVQSTNFRYPPKLEVGPDGRLIRIRDSDENSHQSESPSPVDGVSRVGKNLTGEESSDLSQERFPGSDVRFSGQLHGHTSATQQHIGPHSPIASGMALQSSSREYYDDVLDGSDSPTMPTSSQWTHPTYFAYSASPPPHSPIHDPFPQHPSLQSSSLEHSRWEPGISHTREEFSLSPRVRPERQATGSEWCSEGRAAQEQAMASQTLSHSSEAASTASVRTREPGRTRANSTAWGWEEQGAMRTDTFLPITATRRRTDDKSGYGPPLGGWKDPQPCQQQRSRLNYLSDLYSQRYTGMIR